MKYLRRIAIMLAVMLVLSLGLIACNKEETPFEKKPDGAEGVVKAFNAIDDSDAITQTAEEAENDKYSVTVIAESYAYEYTLNSEFEVENERAIVGKAKIALGDERSTLERAYDEAIKQSGIAPENITGFDFDRDTYMGIEVFKVEIEEVGAKYKYIFKATDMSIVGSEIEFENSLPTGSYIGEDKAEEIALAAASAADNASDIVVRSLFVDGKKQYRVSFNSEGCRYDVNVDAVSGKIVKFSKSMLGGDATPALPEIMTEEQVKEIALAFVFPNSERGEYTFRKVKLDYDDGMFVYEVELIAGNTEYEFEIAAASGGIIDVEIDNYEHKSEQLPQNKRFITREQAIEAVKKSAGENVYILEVEIDSEGIGADKTYYYEIEVRANGVEYEYHVDALTGVATLQGGETPDTVITKDDAVRIAVEHFELDMSSVDRKWAVLEREDGRLCFEVKLYVGNVEYKAEIDAESGDVLKAEIEQDEPSAPPSELLTSEQAIELVKKEAGSNAVVIEIDYGYENGRYVYEIEVKLNGIKYDYYVDASTGEVSRNEDFVDEGSVALTEDEALDIAFEFFKVKRSDANIHKVKLDRDDGRFCYEIEFFIESLKYEIEIDAETGGIIESERSYD